MSADRSCERSNHEHNVPFLTEPIYKDLPRRATCLSPRGGQSRRETQRYHGPCIFQILRSRDQAPDQVRLKSPQLPMAPGSASELARRRPLLGGCALNSGRKVGGRVLFVTCETSQGISKQNGSWWADHRASKSS